jgi:hypothetical protein
MRRGPLTSRQSKVAISRASSGAAGGSLFLPAHGTRRFLPCPSTLWERGSQQLTQVGPGKSDRAFADWAPAHSRRLAGRRSMRRSARLW